MWKTREFQQLQNACKWHTMSFIFSQFIIFVLLSISSSSFSVSLFFPFLEGWGQSNQEIHPPPSPPGYTLALCSGSGETPRQRDQSMIYSIYILPLLSPAPSRTPTWIYHCLSILNPSSPLPHRVLQLESITAFHYCLWWAQTSIQLYNQWINEWHTHTRRSTLGPGGVTADNHTLLAVTQYVDGNTHWFDSSLSHTVHQGIFTASYFFWL